LNGVCEQRRQPSDDRLGFRHRDGGDDALRVDDHRAIVGDLERVDLDLCAR
jgi:hypothetical protein